MSESFFRKAEEYRKKAEYNRAIELYHKALNACRKDSDVSGMLDCYLSLGDTLRAKGDFTKAVVR